MQCPRHSLSVGYTGNVAFYAWWILGTAKTTIGFFLFMVSSQPTKQQQRLSSLWYVYMRKRLNTLRASSALDRKKQARRSPFGLESLIPFRLRWRRICWTLAAVSQVEPRSLHLTKARLQQRPVPVLRPLGCISCSNNRMMLIAAQATAACCSLIPLLRPHFYCLALAVVVVLHLGPETHCTRRRSTLTRLVP